MLLTQDQRMIREAIREFVAGDIAANAAREAGSTVVAVATIADRATGAAGVFAEAGLEYRFVYGLAELGLA